VSVCTSACNNLAPTGQILMKFEIWGFFKDFLKIQVLLKSDNNNECFP